MRWLFYDKEWKLVFQPSLIYTVTYPVYSIIISVLIGTNHTNSLWKLYMLTIFVLLCTKYCTRIFFKFIISFNNINNLFFTCDVSKILMNILYIFHLRYYFWILSLGEKSFIFFWKTLIKTLIRNNVNQIEEILNLSIFIGYLLTNKWLLS